MGGAAGARKRMTSSTGNPNMRTHPCERLLSLLILGVTGLWQPAAAEPPDARPTLYVTSTAHLDTQWLWTIQKTIDEYLPNTLRQNFALFEKFPNYQFSFEGAFRYALAREYYPQDYARLKDYIRQGRWHVCGSSIDAGDVNVPSPESLVRQALYGNLFFEREFDKRSTDIYLPDCFGFGYALPSIAAHCGLKGFSTQKLTWGSAVGIPFDVGFWEGVDGRGVVAALNPGSYVSTLRTDLSEDGEWLQRITDLGTASGSFVGYKYVGVGDVGGAPDEESVAWLEKSMAGSGPLRVVNTPADRMYQDLTAAQIAKLPRYAGELLMTRHGTGCYTSQCVLKRWNRMNEQLADAAERACVAADWLGGSPYPTDTLEESWRRFLWHQFHDDLPGTSIPQAYTFSWNDQLLSLNQFAGELTRAVAAISQSLDTSTEGLPLVVYNPLAIEREGVVEATVPLGMGTSVTGLQPRVYGPDGTEVPAQVLGRGTEWARVLFLARVPPAGFAVYEVRPSRSPCPIDGGLTVTDRSLDSPRYRVELDDNGDVARIFDKVLQRELLRGPLQLQLLDDQPDDWPEWEIRHQDISAQPYAGFAAPAAIRIAERGPARIALEITRKAHGSVITQALRLSGGDAAARLEFDNRVSWHTPRTLLKACFPLTSGNPLATYDLGFGVIQRPQNTPQKYEVPAQQWADLSDPAGHYGVAILNDCKYGWDKPDDHTLRLTLIHTPNDVQKDMGWHRFAFAVQGHDGDWRRGDVIHQAAAFNQPLRAFCSPRHGGALGRTWSFLEAVPPQVVVRALKQAERGDDIIVRLQEAHGAAVRDVPLVFAAAIENAREVDGQERPIADVAVQDGRLLLDFNPFQPRTFAVRLSPNPGPQPAIHATPVQLPYDADVISTDDNRHDGDFDGRGHSLPAELIPQAIRSAGIPFEMGATVAGAKNAVICRGQTLALPPGDFTQVYVLAAAVGDATRGTFHLGDTAVAVDVHGFSGWIGQADSLVVDGKLVSPDSMTPAFVDHDAVAWVGTHRHDATANRNEPYVFCYLFRYGLNLPPATATITLPRNPGIRILALTAARDPAAAVQPARPLYDHLVSARVQPHGGLYIEPVTVRLSTRSPDDDIVYTLDGTEPDGGSPRYSGPITVTADAVISARVLPRLDGQIDPIDYVTRARFQFAEPVAGAPAPPPGAAPGVQYRYFEGHWDRLPDFEALAPARSGTLPAFQLPADVAENDFGVELRSRLHIAEAGVYTFLTSSDDGSRLWVGDALVVDNDGLHGARERSGQIALGPGHHVIRVTFFERGGDQALEVSFAGPGFDTQPIPPELLHQP